MTQKTRMIIFSTVVVLALSAPAAFAVPTDARPRPGKAMMEKREAKREQLYKDLNLTAEQKAALEANKNKNRGQMKAQFQAMRDQTAALQQELQKDKLDMGKINQIQASLKEMQSKMLDRRLEGILEVRKILSPEQFKKFMTNMESQKNRWGHKSEGKAEVTPGEK